MEYDIEINKYGDKFYYKKGTKTLHRENGPAIEGADSYRGWLIDGKFHRTDGPAVEYCDDDRFWFVNGELVNGSNEWHINGERLSPEKEKILNQWWDNKNGI